MKRKISLEYALQHFPDEIKFIYDLDLINKKKQNFSEKGIIISPSESQYILRKLPLLQAQVYLNRILQVGTQDKLSKIDKEKLEFWQEKYEAEQKNYHNLPPIKIWNSNSMLQNYNLVRNLQILNNECQNLQKVRRDNLVVDIGLGGSMYLLYEEGKKIKAYSKLVPLSLEGQISLSLDSMETYDAGIQRLEQWKENNMINVFYAMYASAIIAAQVFSFESVITRAPEAAEFSKILGIPQKKYGKKGIVSQRKIGVDITLDKKMKGLYKDLGVKARTLSMRPITNFFLKEEIENLNQVKQKTDIQEAYIQICRQLFTKS